VRSPSFDIGMAIVLFWVFCAIFGYAIVPYPPTKTNLLDANKPPFDQDWFGTLTHHPLPSKGTHLFGTDNLGRDVFSRVITGARDILIVAPLATLIGTVLGAALGLMLGYMRGWVDDVGSRFVEAILALPIVVTALMVLAALGPSDTAVIITIGLIFTPLIARTVRSAVLAERELEYVAAARLRGENGAHIMFIEILPNVMPPIIVEFTVRLGYAIFAIATLSFLGFGIQPPSPDWGLQIASTYPLIPAGYWWESAFPALAIATLVVSVNLVADAVQQAVER
jgi:peptide/nickel transport system permease protein